MVPNIISVCACNFLGVLKNGDKYHFCMTKSTGEMSKVTSSQGLRGAQRNALKHPGRGVTKQQAMAPGVQQTLQFLAGGISD